MSLVPLFIEKESSGQSKLKIGFYKESDNSFTGYGNTTRDVDNINFNFDDENKNALIAKIIEKILDCQP